MSEPVLGEVVLEGEGYRIEYSWFPAWPEELHFHLEVPKPTPSIFKEVNRVMTKYVETIKDLWGIATFYAIIEKDDKAGVSKCRMLKMEPFEEYTYEGKDYTKYRRII